MKIQPIKFQLSKDTIRLLEKSTKCSIKELRTLPLEETQKLIKERGAIKKHYKNKQ